MGIDSTQKPPLDSELRRRAEEQFEARAMAAHSTRSAEEAQRLVHELEVHQIELELQNGELRQAQDALECALDKYTDLYDLAPVGYLTLDREGAIGTANLTLAALLEMERGRLPGRRFGLFLVPSSRRVFRAFLDQVFSSRGKQTCEVELLIFSQGSNFVQIEARAAASGLECRAAVIDISQRRELRRQIEKQHAQLAAANIELEAFNYTISHDLRAPLTVIQGYSQVLLESCDDQFPGPAKGCIREILDGAVRMNRLLDNLLEFSRSAHVDIHRQKVDLSKMAEDVAAELRMRNPEHPGTFRIAAGIVTEGDPDLLRVLLNNLLGNAWKYSGQEERPVIEFGSTEMDGKPTCYVRDNGQGFDMAHAGKLFVPFQRLPGAIATGHGIGLATVDRIVRRHGGRVWAESEPGKSTTFSFTLA